MEHFNATAKPSMRLERWHYYSAEYVLPPIWLYQFSWWFQSDRRSDCIIIVAKITADCRLRNRVGIRNFSILNPGIVKTGPGLETLFMTVICVLLLIVMRLWRNCTSGFAFSHDYRWTMLFLMFEMNSDLTQSWELYRRWRYLIKWKRYMHSFWIRPS